MDVGLNLCKADCVPVVAGWDIFLYGAKAVGYGFSAGKFPSDFNVDSQKFCLKQSWVDDGADGECVVNCATA